MRLALSLAAALHGILIAGKIGQAGDWPQILGPNRNGIASADEKIASRWPAAGPPTVWERPVGAGYAGLAVKGERGVLFHRQRDEEVIEVLDVATGKTLARDSYPTTFFAQVGSGNGPLCVPTIQDDRIVTFGAQGVLTCLDLQTGKRLWQRKTHEDFGAREGYFGAGSSPLIVNDSVIVNVGGSRDEAGIVSFSLKDGHTLWKKTEEPASYSAPVSVQVNNLVLVMMVTRYRCQLLDPRSGAILFQFPFGQRGPTVNGASPIVMGDRFLVTSAYGIGSVYGKWDPLNFQKIWEAERPLATQYCTPIFFKDRLYVIDGRDDVPPADLKCINPEPANAASERSLEVEPVVEWVEQNFGYGTLVLVDGKLLAVKTDGHVLMIDPVPSRYHLLDEAKPLPGIVRALPAISNGRMYLRNEDTLKCLNLAPRL